MAKELLYGEDARVALANGANTLTDILRGTLGPRGRGVALRQSGRVLLTQSSAATVRDFCLTGQFEDIGAQLVRRMAEGVRETAGDGATTAAVLAQALVQGGRRCLAAGCDAGGLRRGIALGCDAAVASLREQARPLADRKDIAHVAGRACGDEEIGNLVAEALERVGRNGVITCEEAQTTGVSIEITEGMQFDQGWLSPHMVTVALRGKAVLKDALVLTSEGKMSTARELVPVLEAVVSAGRPLLILADDVEGEALAALLVNIRRGTLRALAVKAPEYGERRREMLRDVASLTGSTVISPKLGLSLEDIRLWQLGRVTCVESSKTSTTLIGGGGNKEDIAARVHEVEVQIEHSRNKYDRERNKARLGRLVGGVAVLRAGATTQAELTDRKLRIDDAINVANAAVAEGVLPGGGSAYAASVPSVESLLQTTDGDIRTGVRLLAQALWAPLRQIAENAGADGAAVAAAVYAKDRPGWGYDARTGKVVDMESCGIIDPLQVVRTALENAASTAALLLTAGALVAEEES